MTGELHKLAAFTDSPAGGNPAGVWIGDTLPPTEDMQRIAAEVGYSETAFIAPRRGRGRTIRYFSPQAEVPFCGHATIASGVALAEENGEGDYLLESSVGVIPVAVTNIAGKFTASLTSVRPEQAPADASLVERALAALGWRRDELDASLVPVKAYAGAWHLVLAAADKSRLDSLDYDFDAAHRICVEQNLATLQLVWRESDRLFHSRNPFPVGGVVEDPATGAAAAALGGYLRDAGLIEAPVEITVRQGEAMGRPSVIRVDIPTAGGIIVSGTAVRLDQGRRPRRA